MARSKTKRYVIGAATFTTALAIGFVLQYGDAVAARFGVESAETSPEVMPTLDESAILVPVSASIATPRALNTPMAPIRDPDVVAVNTVPTDISVPVIVVPTSDEPASVAAVEIPNFDNIESDTSEIELAAVETGLDVIVPELSNIAEIQQDFEVAELSCDVKAFAMAADFAMVDLSVDAPCHSEQAFLIHHQGVSVSVQTDDIGLAQVKMPALNENALFIISFEDGQSAMANATVTDLAEFDRAVLQWQGVQGFELHALEFGAEYGSEGHIWSGAAIDPITAERGLLTVFSDGLHAAEIYTYPTGQSSSSGSIDLNVEAQVTEANCGTTVTAQAIQLGPNRSTSVTDLEMKMPECVAIGEYLVLKNLFEDLTLAAK